MDSARHIMQCLSLKTRIYKMRLMTRQALSISPYRRRKAVLARGNCNGLHVRVYHRGAQFLHFRQQQREHLLKGPDIKI